MVNIPEITGLEISLDSIEKSRKEEEFTSSTFYKEVERKFTEQIDIEKDFLSHHRWNCVPASEKSLLKHAETHDLKYSNIDRDENSTHVFLDSESLEKLACIANNIILFDGPNYRTGYNFIKKIITNVRLIGTPSVNGYVMSATLYDRYKDLVVIKAPQKTMEYTDAAIDHELVVGKVLNNLRSVIPNFAFVLGSFECGSPVVRPPVESSSKSPGKVLTWCRGGSKVKYLMYENIGNSMSFYKYVKTCSAQDYIDIIIQLNYALAIAYKDHGFTHYDLHGDNVLIRDVGGSGYYVPYMGDFVLVNKLATIIDYGFSHVYLPDGKNTSVGYKNENGPKYNIKMKTPLDRPNPIADSYRIMFATIEYMKSVNPSVYEKVKGLLYFFHPKSTDIDTIFSFDREVDISRIPYFGIPSYVEKIKKFRHKNLIKYCRDYAVLNDMDDPVISGNDYSEFSGQLESYVLMPSLNMNHNHLLNSKDSEQILRKKIDTVDELFDLIEPILLYKKHIDENNKGYGEAKSKNQIALLEKIFQKLSNQKEYIREIISEEINNLVTKLNKLKTVNYNKLPPQDVYMIRNSTAMKTYLNMLEETIRYLDDIEAYEKKIEMIRYIKENILREPEGMQNLESIFKTRDDRKVILRFISHDMNSLGDYLDSKSKLDDIDRKLDIIYQSLVAVYPF